MLLFKNCFKKSLLRAQKIDFQLRYLAVSPDTSRFITQTWRSFCLISTLIGNCERMKGELWLPVFMGGLQSMCDLLFSGQCYLPVNARHYTNQSLQWMSDCQFELTNFNLSLKFYFFQICTGFPLNFQQVLTGCLLSLVSFWKAEN